MCVEEGCALLGRGGCGGGRGVSVRVTVASISNQYYRYMGSAPTSMTHAEDSEREAVVTLD